VSERVREKQNRTPETNLVPLVLIRNVHPRLDPLQRGSVLVGAHDNRAASFRPGWRKSEQGELLGIDALWEGYKWRQERSGGSGGSGGKTEVDTETEVENVGVLPRYDSSVRVTVEGKSSWQTLVLLARNALFKKGGVLPP
jgi:hypothetical protein